MVLTDRYPCVMWMTASTVIFMTAGKRLGNYRSSHTESYTNGQSSRAGNNR